MEPGDEWPEHPWDAVYHSGRGLLEFLEGWRGHGWSVPHEPPGQFPFIDPPFPRALYGPPGTAWVFSEADMLAGLVNLPGGVARWALNRALRKLGVTVGAGSLLFWRTPEESIQPIGPDMAFRWLRTTIVGTIGTTEGVAHVLNWRPATAPDGDLSVAQVQAHGDKIRDQWATFINGGAVRATKTILSPNLVYKEVRTAYMEQATAATVTTHTGKRGPVKDFHYPRPTYIVPTQYSTFAGGAAVGAAPGNDLPWEVALCLSLSTGQRGPRNRGRLYLGPLSVGPLTTNGIFDTSVDDIANNFANLFLKPANTATATKLMVVSRAYATALPITGVSVGHVPDSQRRRRKKQPEIRTTPVAIP